MFGGFLLLFAVFMFYQGLTIAAARASVVFGVLASAGAVVVVVRTVHAGTKTDPDGVTVVPVFGRARRRIFQRTAKRSELARAQGVLRALDAERQHWTARA